MSHTRDTGWKEAVENDYTFIAPREKRNEEIQLLMGDDIW